MLKVQATNGNTFEFDADEWSGNSAGLVLFKGSRIVAQFSAYNFVQRVADPVVEAPPVEPEPEAPVEPSPTDPEPQPEEPEAPQDETTEPLA